MAAATASIGAVAAFRIEAMWESENPERVWNDPEGCGPALWREWRG